MKRIYTLSIIVLLLVLGTWLLAQKGPGQWAGVDESVVERYAEMAGHPASAPFINTDRGDLLLFVFLLAGAIGGFVAGYAYRSLFPEKTESPTP